MAGKHGKSGAVYVDIAEVPEAVAEVTGFDYTEDASVTEDTVMGDTAKTYKAGINDGSGRVDCQWDPADTEQKTLRAGETVTLHLYPDDITVGEVELTGSVVIGSINITSSKDDMNKATFTFKGVLTEQAISV